MLFRNDKKDPPQPGSRLRVPLLPLRDIIVFPHMVVPLFVGRQQLDPRARRGDEQAEVHPARRPEGREDQRSDRRGHLPRRHARHASSSCSACPTAPSRSSIEGKKRARVAQYVDHAEFFLVEVDEIVETCDKTTELEALIRSVNSTFENYVKLNKKIPPEMIMSVASIDDPARLADTIVAHLGIKLEDKQTLLELLDPAERLEKVLGYMRSEIEILEVEKRIRTRVKKQMEKTQKEYYLNEQMRAIQKELGEKDEFKNEIQELEEKIKQKKMSAGGAGQGGERAEEAQDDVADVRRGDRRSELHRLADHACRGTSTRKTSSTSTDAEKVLEEDHYGLEKVKQRILEYLAVQSLVGQLKGPILCLVGPPGVGKTSLGKSIARATGPEVRTRVARRRA